jgi:galactose-1-phosphate uridylyltransferase
LKKIKFEKIIQEAKLRSPLNGFRQTTQRIEVRKDPLTGKRCRINIERTKRPKQTWTKTAELDELIESSKAKCFFCPENIEKMTPRFTEGLPNRIWVDKACLFPNLFPFGRNHAVGIFSEKHYLELDRFTPKLLENCFKACLRYFELIHARHPEIRYWYINWNHLPPGAASIIHPHVQIFADSGPTSYLRELIEKSKAYHDSNGGNYWSDLARAEEANKSRFIGKTGSIYWLASFAPQSNREVTAIFSDTSSMAGLKGRGLSEFCIGLSSILKGYHAVGVQSFNMATFSGPCDDDLSDFYLLNAKLISRPDPAPFYTSDNGFMEKLHQEAVIETMPEALAGKLRKYLILVSF